MDLSKRSLSEQRKILDARLKQFGEQLDALETKYGAQFDRTAVFQEMQRSGEMSPSVSFKKLRPDLEVESHEWSEPTINEKITRDNLTERTHEALTGQPYDPSSPGQPTRLNEQEAPNLKNRPKKDLTEMVNEYLDKVADERGEEHLGDI